MPALVRPVSYGPSSAADPAEGRSFGGAFWVSVFLHALTVALIVLFTIALRDRPKPEPKIFELVAGAGDNFAANEAPAGSEAGQATVGEITFSAPEVPVWTPPPPVPVEALAPPTPEPTPPPPTPVSRVAPVPVEPAKPVVQTPPAQPTPNFTRQINRTLQREKQKTERELQQQREREAREARERELNSKRLTHEEYMRTLNRNPSPAPQRTTSNAAPAPGPRLDPSAIRQGVTGATGAQSAGAGGTAAAAAEAAAMDRYFAMLMQRLRESHEQPPGLSNLLSAEVQFTLSASGTISGVRIVRGSGNAAFDQSVLDAFARVRMPARPDGKSDSPRLTFRLREA
jgi:colicin import membrane protein